MKKVFFDIGTNRFQGYDELKSKLGITDEWHKVFVEPNSDFIKDDDLVQRLKSIPNHKFFGSALCCSCSERTAQLAIEKGKPMDQGSNIFQPKWIQEGRPYQEVSVINFEELCEGYHGFDWYMKFDCECCEWSCLDHVLDRYHESIKFLICEFHAPDPDPDIRERLKEKIKSYGIAFEEWK